MKLEEYVDQVVHGLPCSRREKQDVKDELLDHVTNMKQELMEEGYAEQEAVALAIRRFGPADELSRQLSVSMPLLDKYVRKWVLALFGLYVAACGYLLLLSPDRWHRRTFTLEWKERMLRYGAAEYAQIFQNTKPLRTLFDYVFHYEHYNAYTIAYNLLGNIVLFMPLGLLLPLLFAAFQNVHRVFFTALFASLTVEFLQFLLALGSFDVDDLLLNVLGGLGGYGLFRAGAALLYNQRSKGAGKPFSTFS
ncbi:VanZ family protein [Brevibacillus sp. SAFN-007a]|uniref:VanZ family protein n=1 Tax=Brevibacillus sp. SAFN-007a TaxID=3436862 RepID=UPI003F7F66DC